MAVGEFREEEEDTVSTSTSESPLLGRRSGTFSSSSSEEENRLRFRFGEAGRGGEASSSARGGDGPEGGLSSRSRDDAFDTSCSRFGSLSVDSDNGVGRGGGEWGGCEEVRA